MPQFVDENLRREIERRLRDRLNPAADIAVAGPGLGDTDECSVVATAKIEGQQHHREFHFAVADRTTDEVVADLVKQIVYWMRDISPAK